jgi:poly(A) polymerase
VIAVDQHGLQREQISRGCRQTVEDLQENGYQAYVVGGAVRDLLAGLTPKDFDVATNATPEQVRRCFRRSRIIGRRFQIVHVNMGAETIEVTTFRGHHGEDSAHGGNKAQTDAQGRVLRDNVFGSQSEDAARRDFHGQRAVLRPELRNHHRLPPRRRRPAAEDPAHDRRPKTRYREDPVRMLRAVRLAAKLGLAIDPAARRPIREMADLLDNVPPSRLFDEMLKLLTCGHAVRCVTRLREEGLHHGVLPLLDVILEQPLGERFVMLALEATDRRVEEGKPISPGFLFATLLWHRGPGHLGAAEKNSGEPAIPALFLAMDEVLHVQAEKLAITRRIAGDIKDIWALQPRFEQRSGKASLRRAAAATFQGRLRLPAAARRVRRSRAGDRRLVDRVSACQRRGARGDAPAGGTGRPRNAAAVAVAPARTAGKTRRRNDSRDAAY